VIFPAFPQSFVVEVNPLYFLSVDVWNRRTVSGCPQRWLFGPPVPPKIAMSLPFFLQLTRTRRRVKPVSPPFLPVRCATSPPPANCPTNGPCLPRPGVTYRPFFLLSIFYTIWFWRCSFLTRNLRPPPPFAMLTPRWSFPTVGSLLPPASQLDRLAPYYRFPPPLFLPFSQPRDAVLGDLPQTWFP